MKASRPLGDAKKTLTETLKASRSGPVAFPRKNCFKTTNDLCIGQGQLRRARKQAFLERFSEVPRGPILRRPEGPRAHPVEVPLRRKLVWSTVDEIPDVAFAPRPEGPSILRPAWSRGNAPASSGVRTPKQVIAWAAS